VVAGRRGLIAVIN